MMHGYRKALLCTVVVLLCLALALPAQAGDKSLQWNQLPPESLTADGLARIIVGIDVTNYESLAANSSQHQVITPGEADTSRNAAKAADAALENAIANSVDALLASLPKAGVQVNRRYTAFPFLAISVDAKTLEALRADPRITSIEIDAPQPAPVPIPSSPTDAPGATDSPSSNLNWGPPKVGADVAWAKGYTGKGWYVAVLDTGIRRTHEFFAGKNIVEACFSYLNNCPGGTSTAYGKDSAVHYASTYQSYDHGTHCAGIAVGKKANNTVTGVAKDANLIAIQVFSKSGYSTLGSYPSDQLAALNYVYSLRNTYSIASVSMSLGGGGYDSACDSESRKTAIDALRAVRIATAIATGNNGYCGYISIPSCISTSIAVGSSTSSDSQSSFSNFHPTMQRLFAPGSDVYSSTGTSDTSYASWSGTSMATPHVAGAWAILRQNGPTESVSAILSRLMAAGPSISTTCTTPTGSRRRLYIPGALVAGPGKGTVNLLPLDVPAAIMVK